MISSLILLSTAGVFATPVFISDVKASREAGHLRVEVTADGGIDPDGARTVIDDGRLVIYLGGARVRADNRSWELQDGAGEIRAHRHKKETELVVPLAGNGCDGPVELTGSDTGITALVGCDGSVSAKVASAATARARTATPAAETVEKRPAAAPSKQVVRAAPKELTLKALVELPDEDVPAPVPAVAVVKTTAPKEAAATEHPGASTGESTIDRVAAAVAAPVPAATVPAAPAAVAVAGARLVHESGAAPAAPIALVAHAVEAAPFATNSVPAAVPAPAAAPVAAGSLRGVVLPALLLGALAVAAYLLARRRRGTFHRHIEILETASLGPKRSLVVARIGDDTLVLGSSEAGITLLRGSSAAFPAAVAAEVVTQASSAVAMAAGQASAPVPAKTSPERSAGNVVLETDQPLEEALADIPEPDGARGGQGRPGFRAIEGGLAGLFGKRGGTWQREVATPPAFDDLLEDSIEDQELRRKLAAGLSSRVR